MPGQARHASLSAAFSLVVVLALPGPVMSQPGAEPGIAGFWNMSFGPAPPRRPPTPVERDLMASFPDDVVVLADAGVAEFPPGDYGGLQVHESLREAARDYDPRAQTTVANTCRPPGLIYSMQGPFPLEIFEGRDMIVVKLEYFDLVRVIFMNETEHPTDWPHSQTGHSFGRWEGDTLVVDTARLQSGTLFNNGVDYTEDVQLVERFRLSDADTLIVTQQFRDPGSFDGTAARVLSFRRGNDHVYPYDCDPTYGLAMDSLEGPATE
ncbi:MAG: hypothetical protein PVH89_06300 [Gammaproteobacteria bacterium]|jgi:hypothetical protein